MLPPWQNQAPGLTPLGDEARLPFSVNRVCPFFRLPRRPHRSTRHALRDAPATRLSGAAWRPYDYCSAVSTSVNFADALFPMAVTAVMQTTMINASMTAYSVAVGPSSDLRKLFTLSNKFI